jgi:predicted nucleic acid-binding protein
MVLLDTNVISALMRSTPDPVVVAWLDGQTPASIWISSIAIFEVRYGLARLPTGRRKRDLQAAFETVLTEDLEHRVLDFDRGAADAAASLAADRAAAGRPVDLRDTMIAGIAVARRAAIATRNTRHFEGLPVPVLNPWEGPSRSRGPEVPES